MIDASELATRKDNRREFEPVARRHRRHGWIFMGCLCGGMLIGLLSRIFHYERSPWFAAFFILCIVAGFTTLFLGPSVHCPTCRASVLLELQHYCPECGASPLAESWLHSRRCTSCGKRLIRGRRRSYRVRFCTCCGAYLNEVGI